MVWCVSPARARARLAQRSPAPAQASASADPAHQHRRSPTQPAQPSAARQRRLAQRSARPAQRSLAPAPAQSSASAGPVQDSQRSLAHSAAHPQHSCWAGLPPCMVRPRRSCLRRGWAGSTLTSGRGGVEVRNGVASQGTSENPRFRTSTSPPWAQNTKECGDALSGYL